MSLNPRSLQRYCSLLLLTPLMAAADTELLTPGYDWSHFSGTQWDGTRLTVVPLDREIRPKSSDTGKWYLNPPINLMGPRLDFNSATDTITVSLTVDTNAHPDQAAYIDLYGTLPIAYDEWRVDGRNVRLGLTNGTANVWVNMAKQSFSKSGLGNTVTLGVAYNKSTITFSINGTTIGTFKEKSSKPVFKSGHMYFGVDAPIGGGFAVTSLKVNGGSVHDNHAEMISTYTYPTTSLRAKASQLTKPFWIGTAGNADALLNDQAYGKNLAQNFSIMTPENHFKWQFIHPQPNVYAFAESDALAEFAQKNGIRMRGHCLVWHEALPKWVWNLYKNKDSAGLRQALIDHITTLVTRYKGVVKEWDTLNEVFSMDSKDPEGFRNGAEEDNFQSIWYQTFGKQIYIDALKLVKQIDPAAENWINEFGIDQKGFIPEVNNMIKFVNYANNLGFGKLIDGIAFQAHNYDPKGDPSVASELKANMLSIVKATGIKVRISELDVDSASTNPTLFSDKLQVCVDATNPNCSSVSLWGFTDRYGSFSSPTNSGTSGTNYTSPNWGASVEDALIYDENYQAKSAVTAMLNVLK